MYVVVTHWAGRSYVYGSFNSRVAGEYWAQTACTGLTWECVRLTPHAS